MDSNSNMDNNSDKNSYNAIDNIKNDKKDNKKDNTKENIQDKCHKLQIIKYSMGILTVFTMFYFIYILMNTKYTIDKIIVIIGILGQLSLLIGLLLNINILCTISHLIYTIILIITPFITNKRELLLICVILSQFTIFTRKQYDCLFEYLHNPLSISTNILNWDYLYILPGIVGSIRLFKC